MLLVRHETRRLGPMRRAMPPVRQWSSCTHDEHDDPGLSVASVMH